METSKHRLSLAVVFVMLTMISRGSTCEAPSAPECFRRDSSMSTSTYTCEWTMNTTESDVKFDFYMNDNPLKSSKQTSVQILEERLIKHEKVFISVVAHVGNSSCSSIRNPVILADIVKYEAPKNISMSWVNKDLYLNWTSAENHPAFAEVRFRQHSSKSWESRMNTTKINKNNHTFKVSLLRNSSYLIQIRQRSTQVLQPLWSKWSSVMDVPAELEKEPEVSVKTVNLNGTRKVMLRWKPMPHASTITGVDYILKYSRSARGCPCMERTSPIKKTKHTIYVSYSVVNISLIAKNAAGSSPPAVIHLPAFKPDSDLKACEKLDQRGKPKTCREFYELHEDGHISENATILTRWQKKKSEKKLKDFVRYLYVEHKCMGRRPRTQNMCLFYQKEGAPLEEPKDFNAFDETHCSTNLSWQAIPLADLRGFLTHYSLCSRKFNLQEEPEDCHNVSATLLKYRLENLTLATKYIITLAGVTRGGVGPVATVTISTQPEKSFNVWWSLCLLFFFFLMSAFCTFILGRFKMKLFPPVPTPVINFTPYPRENQEMLERKEGEEEEVDQLTILKLLPEDRSVFFKMKKITEDMEIAREDSRMSGEISDEDLDCTDEALRSSKEGDTADMEQLENVFAMLIYRNGLVFDSKTDSP